YISGNFLDQGGIMRNTQSNRYGLTINLESKVRDWLNIGGRINAMRKVSEEPFDLGRVLYIFANGAYPFNPPFTLDGQYGAPETVNNGNLIDGNRNPLMETDNGLTSYEKNFLKMNVFADISLGEHFIVKTNFSSQLNHSLRDKHNEVLYGYTSLGIQAMNLDYP